MLEKGVWLHDFFLSDWVIGEYGRDLDIALHIVLTTTLAPNDVNGSDILA